jgi:hypothetical protein
VLLLAGRVTVPRDTAAAAYVAAPRHHKYFRIASHGAAARVVACVRERQRVEANPYNLQLLQHLLECCHSSIWVSWGYRLLQQIEQHTKLLWELLDGVAGSSQ